MSDRVHLTINGQSVEVEKSSTVFQAAEKAGIAIPHYCYHPDLSVAGVCRMCVVEIEKQPKLQISCNTPVAEGMVVNTKTPKVGDAVKNALEFHLINHPLDCPICDKAGECKLQDYYAKHGLYASRMEDEKVHKPKVQDIGTIMLDSERCILCTRCVRFTAEVTKTNEFGIFNRGDRSVLQTYDGGPLRNDYTGNLADICPVGALTAKDFRFKQRVWFLDKKSSVCTLCARGCNTNVSINPNTKKLYRVEPRRNVDVNKSWICDEGRWGFHFAESKTRVQVPLNATKEATWHEAFVDLRERVQKAPSKVLLALSAHLSLEEIADAVETVGKLGVTRFVRIADDVAVADRKPFDGLLKHADSTPNANGFELLSSSLGWKFLTVKEGADVLKSGEVEMLMCLGIEREKVPGLDALIGAMTASQVCVLHVSNHLPFEERAQWVLPNITAYEKAGTFANALGRVQKVQGPLAKQYTARGVHEICWGLEQGSDREPCPSARARHIFENVVRDKVLKEPRLTWNRFPELGFEIVKGPERAAV